MRFFKNLARGARGLFRKESVEREMDEELREFLDASVADKLNRGMLPEQAIRAARAEMGSGNAVKHHIRSTGWESSLEILLQDLRHSLRGLLRTPGFTFVAVLSLALGIGANTAIFTLIRQVMLHNLPVRDPQQLVTFGTSEGDGILGGIDLGMFDQFTYDFAHQLELQPGPFSGVAYYSSFPPKVSVRNGGAEAAVQVSASLVSGNYFSVLGAAPFFGRAIFPSDADAPNRSAVVVISHHYWQQILSADPAIVGKTISVNSTPFTVVGVMPEAFHGFKQELEPPDLWVPITMVEQIMLQPNMLTPRSFYFLHMFARRSTQSTLSADQAWLDRRIHDYVRAGEGATIAAARLQEIDRLTVRLIPASHGVSFMRTQYGMSLKILMAVVAIVLLIACSNLANFLLARGVSRQREIATRLALGSTRSRIVRQSLIESLILSMAGGAFGLAIAFAATRALIVFVAEGATYTALDPLPDTAVLLFTIGVSLLAGLLFGLAPALHAARSSAGPVLSANTRTVSSGGGSRSRLAPKALVVAQIMLSLLLLVGAGLFLRTLRNLQGQDYGFERSRLLIAGFDARLAGYKPEQVPELNRRLVDRLSTLPGVRAAALSSTPPISMGSWRSSISIPGYTPQPKEDMGSPINRVSGQYFEATGIPLVAGRAIAPSDQAGSLKVAVINETMARRFFPNGGAVGRSVKINIDAVAGPWQIVGVARDTKSGDPREKAQRMIYLPLSQIVGKNGEGIGDSFAYSIALRTSGEPASTIQDLRTAIASVDPNLPLLQVRTIQEHLETFMSHEALISRLTVIFALLALLLACIGLYGVMSFNVARRSNEIGIRIALGATGGGVRWMVLRESILLLVAGLLLGLPISLGAANMVRSQLYELSPFDPAILLTSGAVIAAVSLFTAWLPARRASAVDPMIALRCE